MKAIRIEQGSPVLRELPKPSGDGVVVKVASASICGTDLHMMKKGWMEGVVPGHEFAGYTADGTAVAVEPVFGCGSCHYCDDGYYTHCENGSTMIGGRINGGMAEYVEVPASTIYELPSGLDVTTASLIEPLAVAIHGLNQGRVTTRDRVLVLGAGAVGLATAAALQARNIGFDMVARHAHQREAAVRFGAGFNIGQGYDVVLDAVGTSETIKESVKCLRPRSRLVVLGCFWEPTAFPFFFCANEIEAIACMAYKCRRPNRCFEEAGRILYENPHVAQTLFTHDFSLEGAAEAFATVSDRSTGAIKVRAFYPRLVVVQGFQVARCHEGLDLLVGHIQHGAQYLPRMLGNPGCRVDLR